MNNLNLSASTRKIIPRVVAIAFFINSLDSMILNIAIPTVAQSFHESPLELKLAITSYLLSMGVFIPVSGWLADKFGTRKIFMVAIGLFGLGSLGCGLAHALYQLVLTRIIQGMGGAMMLPVGRIALNKIYPPSQIFKVMATVTVISLIGPAIGPLLGGLIVSYFSWRWIFFINLPFVVAGLILTNKFMPNLINTEVDNLDWLGFILFGMGVACLAFGFSAIGSQALPLLDEMILLIMAIITFLLYYLHHQQKGQPFINTEVFQIRTYRLALLSSTSMRLGTSAISFLLALMLQLAYHLSPLQAALILLPYPVGMLITKPFQVSIVSRLGLRRALLYNTMIITLIIASFCFLQPIEHIVLTTINLFLFGFTISLQYSMLQTLNIVNSTQRLLGQMISLANALQQVTSSFSVALSALLLQLFLLRHHHHVFNPQAFHSTFAVIAGIVLMSTYFFLQLKPEDGQEVTGYKSKDR